MSQIERIISGRQLVRLSFMQDAVAADQTDADLPRAETGATSGTTAVIGYEAPFDGCIVAAAATLSAAGTAGTLDIVPTVAGTAQTDPALAITTEAALTDLARRDTTRFSAGDAIGAQLTTDASWDGTSSDLAVDLYVIYDLADTAV